MKKFNNLKVVAVSTTAVLALGVVATAAIGNPGTQTQQEDASRESDQPDEATLPELVDNWSNAREGSTRENPLPPATPLPEEIEATDPIVMALDFADPRSTREELTSRATHVVAGQVESVTRGADDGWYVREVITIRDDTAPRGNTVALERLGWDSRTGRPLLIQGQDPVLVGQHLLAFAEPNSPGSERLVVRPYELFETNSAGVVVRGERSDTLAQELEGMTVDELRAMHEDARAVNTR